MIQQEPFLNRFINSWWFVKSGELRLTQTYRAKVVDNVDPLHQNRVKVYIPELMKNVEGIWARPLYSFKKVAITPQVGDVVLVLFENGNLQFPVYIGHDRLSCPDKKEPTLCGCIEDKVKDPPNTPLDFWLLETPEFRRVRLDDFNDRLQIGNYQTKRIFEIDDKNQFIKLESQTTNRVIKIDDKAKKIIISTPKAHIIIDDNEPSIDATIGQSKVHMKPDSIKANCSGSFALIDPSKIQLKANVILLN